MIRFRELLTLDYQSYARPEFFFFCSDFFHVYKVCVSAVFSRHFSLSRKGIHLSNSAIFINTPLSGRRCCRRHRCCRRCCSCGRCRRCPLNFFTFIFFYFGFAILVGSCFLLTADRADMVELRFL